MRNSTGPSPQCPSLFVPSGCVTGTHGHTSPTRVFSWGGPACAEQRGTPCPSLLWWETEERVVGQDRGCTPNFHMA